MQPIEAALYGSFWEAFKVVSMTGWGLKQEDRSWWFLGRPISACYSL
jgi:hypothetical protein